MYGRSKDSLCIASADMNAAKRSCVWIVREHRKMSACETALVSEPGNRIEQQRGFVGEHRKVTAHETAVIAAQGAEPEHGFFACATIER